MPTESVVNLLKQNIDMVKAEQSKDQLSVMLLNAKIEESFKTIRRLEKILDSAAKT